VVAVAATSAVGVCYLAFGGDAGGVVVKNLHLL
jgi:hypothetical protein